MMRIGIDARALQGDLRAFDSTRDWAWQVIAHIMRMQPSSADVVCIVSPGRPISLPATATRVEVPAIVDDFPPATPASAALNGAYNALLATCNLDVLHIWDVFNPFLSLPGHIVTCPYLVTLFDEFPFVPQPSLTQQTTTRQRLEWYVERAGVMMRAEHVLAPSERGKREIAATFGVRDAQISVFNPPVEAEQTARDLAARYRTFAGTAATNKTGLRVAMWTPLRPTRSGIADYVEELLPFLTAPSSSSAPALRVDLYSRDDAETCAVRDHCVVLPPSAFEAIHRHQPYDALVYQVGSTVEHHDYICEQSLQQPGLVVMHDPNIHSYALHRMKTSGMAGYLDWVRRELGDGAMKYAQRAWREGNFREKVIYEYPLDRWLLSRSRGVIYHSYFAMQDARRRLPSVPVFYVPMYAPAPTASNSVQRRRILQRHGWPPDTVLIGAYGIAAPSKRLDVLIRAFSRIQDACPQARLLIVGSTAHYDVEAEIEKSGAHRDRVCVTGEVNQPDFIAYMQSADLGVNLRYPSLGESSAVIGRLIGMGKPIITSDIPQFRELPESFCLRVPVGGDELTVLSDALAELISDPTRRRAMAQAALAYGRASMPPQIAADGYRQVIAHVFGGGPLPRLEEMIPPECRQRADAAVLERRLRQEAAASAQ